MENVSPDGWLDLGIPGAALFIILVLVLLIFKQQATSIDKLCDKIDSLVNSFADNNLKLNEVIIVNEHDQKEVIRKLDVMDLSIRSIENQVNRIDSLLDKESTI